MSVTPKQLLEEARELIAKPGGWYPATQTLSGEGTCHCAATAIWNAGENHGLLDEADEVVYAGRRLASFAGVNLPYSSHGHSWNEIFIWNDHSTQEEVVATFDKAIESA